MHCGESMKCKMPGRSTISRKPNKASLHTKQAFFTNTGFHVWQPVVFMLEHVPSK
ncbi:hypothetical protein C8Q75DRAFT_768168 [Abortiporus biennis]|nr:hypothetical protein C8Q75DRAFT_768168 [Abortiporus biennis]